MREPHMQTCQGDAADPEGCTLDLEVCCTRHGHHENCRERHTDSYPACTGDDNCIECATEVEVHMPGTVAKLEAEVDALRTTIQAFQRDKERWLREQMKADREVAALRAERDSYAFEMRNERARADITEAEVERMRPVVEAAIAVIETDKRLYHGSAEHAEAEAEAAFTALDEAVDAYRATSEQETTNAN